MNDKLKFGQYKICIEKYPKEHSEYINSIKNNTDNVNFKKLKAAFLKKFNWNVGDIITIGFIGDGSNVKRQTYEELSNSIDLEGNFLKVDPLQKIVDKMTVTDAIKLIVKERFEPIVNLSLQFVNNYKDAKVRISFDPDDGAWSVIGTQCLTDDPDIKDKATMNLGWFDVSTTCHEFGHVFSMIHEHNNPSENPIQWNVEAVYEWARSTQNWDETTTKENILQKYTYDQLNGSIFDPLSIMLYFFPPELTLNHQGTRQNLKLSGYDVIYLNKIYPGSSMTPSEFYKKAFNEDINENLKNSQKYLTMIYPKSKNYLMYIIIFSIIIIIGIIIKILF